MKKNSHSPQARATARYWPGTGTCLPFNPKYDPDRISVFPLYLDIPRRSRQSYEVPKQFLPQRIRPLPLQSARRLKRGAPPDFGCPLGQSGDRHPGLRPLGATFC